MTEKKDPGKFTVRFNIADPQQRTVIELLNQQGRYKAQFLTNAVLYYVRSSEIPDRQRVPTVDSGEIERIVRSVIAGPKSAPSTKAQAHPPEDSDKDAIFKTLEAFRQQ